MGALVPRWRERSLSWRSGAEIIATVEFGSSTYSDSTGTLWLRYAVDGKPMYYTVTLVSTVPHYGGRRWWCWVCCLSNWINPIPLAVSSMMMCVASHWEASAVIRFCISRTLQ